VTPRHQPAGGVSTAGSSFPTGLGNHLQGDLWSAHECRVPPARLYNGNGNASVDFSSASNVTYHILAGGVNGFSGNLVLSVTLTNPPANDLCSGAIDLSIVRPTLSPTIYATETGDAIDGCGGSLSHGGVVYGDAEYQSTGDNQTTGSSFPTGLAIYTGTCERSECRVQPAAYYNGNGNASVDFSSASNVTYHILPAE